MQEGRIFVQKEMYKFMPLLTIFKHIMQEGWILVRDIMEEGEFLALSETDFDYFDSFKNSQFLKGRIFGHWAGSPKASSMSKNSPLLHKCAGGANVWTKSTFKKTMLNVQTFAPPARTLMQEGPILGQWARSISIAGTTKTKTNVKI